MKYHKLSILIPVHNEENYIGEVIDRVQKVKLNLDKELIIVDDGSMDQSNHIIRKYQKIFSNIVLIEHTKRSGKGKAIQSAIQHATGDIFIIQDADLEYNPHDYSQLIEPILQEKTDVVYGSRFLNKKMIIRYRLNWIFVKLMKLLIFIFFGKNITDEATGYKVFSADIFNRINIKEKGFNWEPEITVKLLKNNYTIYEVPIHYYPRTFEEGKKIKWTDGIEAIWTLMKYRFTD